MNDRDLSPRARAWLRLIAMTVFVPGWAVIMRVAAMWLGAGVWWSDGLALTVAALNAYRIQWENEADGGLWPWNMKNEGKGHNGDGED